MTKEKSGAALRRVMATSVQRYRETRNALNAGYKPGRSTNEARARIQAAIEQADRTQRNIDALEKENNE